MNDRITFLRNKYSDAIKAKEGEIIALKQKLTILDELESDSSGFSEATTSVTDDAEKTTNSFDGAGHTGLTTEALRAVNKLSAGGKWTTAPEVRKFLIRNGFTAISKNFPILVGTTLKRLASSGRIKTRSFENSRQYNS